jgi:hypothetical protein
MFVTGLRSKFRPCAVFKLHEVGPAQFFFGRAFYSSALRSRLDVPTP